MHKLKMDHIQNQRLAGYHHVLNVKIFAFHSHLPRFKSNAHAPQIGYDPQSDNYIRDSI